MRKLIQKSWCVVMMVVFALFSVALSLGAIVTTNSLIWQIVFVATMAIAGFVTLQIARDSYETKKMRVMKASMVSSIILILPAIWWTLLSSGLQSIIGGFSIAMFFAWIGCMALFSTDQSKEKMIRVLTTLLTVFFMGMAIVSLGHAVSMLIALPAWLGIALSIVESISCGCFILAIGVGAVMLWRVSENESCGKLYLRIVSVMAWCIFFGSGLSFVFDLLGMEYAFVATFTMWGIVASFVALLVTGVCHFVAYICSKA